MSARGRPKRRNQGRRPAWHDEEPPRGSGGASRQQQAKKRRVAVEEPSSPGEDDSQDAWYENAGTSAARDARPEAQAVQGPCSGCRHPTDRSPARLTAATTAEMKRLVSAAFAPATQAAYKQGIESFEVFRGEHGLGHEWPVPSQHVIHFAAHLSLTGRAHTTARTYLAGIGAKHKLKGWDDPTEHFLLKKLLQGMAKLDRRQDQRKPITFQRLKDLIGVLPGVCANTFEQALFTAAFCFAFFGFFRVSEIVGQGNAVKGGRTGISYADVVLGEDLTVHIAGSKTDQANKGEKVVMRRVERHPQVCPVRAMEAYLRVRPCGPGPLWKHFDGSSLTRYQFQAVLKKGASVLGWKVNRFTSHSFRIGAATTAAVNGTPMRDIMALGRWGSQAVTKYVRPDLE
ncbi:uncharacterized protein [Littorina saxatilis]|uniref:uncharacterized protein isoform X1 n=1 Tax=Littorina saxatilis TaxID=31220 RepID=UPI0038B605E7